MRQVPQAAVDLVKRWEGKMLKAYPDPATGGAPWTIGYGHTGGVRPGQIISEAQATTFLRVDLADAGRKISAIIGPIVDEMTDNQYAALLSFVFNVGANPKWTIWKRLKSRQWEAVPAELMRFVNANGKRMQGLANRRAAEAALWRIGEPNTVADNPPSSVTRLADTPPTAAPHNGVASLITGLTAAATAGPAVVKSVIDAVQPYSVFSPTVTTGLGVLACIGAGFAVVNLALTWMRQREAKR